jgi:hypothetical protein
MPGCHFFGRDHHFKGGHFQSYPLKAPDNFADE